MAFSPISWETRQLPQYRLVVAKSGPKLDVARNDSNARPSGTRIGRGLIDAHGIGTAEVAAYLRSELGRPVVDSTGFTGKNKFKTPKGPDRNQPKTGREAPPP